MTPPPVRIDATSAAPPYAQIRAQLAGQIADGVLAAGTRLPTVRKLADELGLAVNTVARSYRELEAAGLVETRGRAGTVVSAAGDQAQAQLQQEASRYAQRASELGIASAQAVALVQAALEANG